jgi:hypothetical protein
MQSNAKLKETVCKLESVLAEMKAAFKKEIKTYQKVIVHLQSENIQLHYKLEALSRSKEDPLELEDTSLFEARRYEKELDL